MQKRKELDGIELTAEEKGILETIRKSNDPAAAAMVAYQVILDYVKKTQQRDGQGGEYMSNEETLCIAPQLSDEYLKQLYAQLSPENKKEFNQYVKALLAEQGTTKTKTVV